MLLILCEAIGFTPSDTERRGSLTGHSMRLRTAAQIDGATRNEIRKANIQKAGGYATFSNLGMKILVAGSGSGEGVAVDSKSKNETFYQLTEKGVALELTAKGTKYYKDDGLNG